MLGIRNIFQKLKLTISNSFFILWLLYISICMTIIFYHWFHNWYLPKIEFQTNIDFELSCINQNHMGKNCELVGSIDLVNYDNEVLMRMGEEYKFILELFVPESDRNFDIDTFGVTAELSDDDQKIIDSFRTTVNK